MGATHETPVLGVVGMAMPGLFLGEELCLSKAEELCDILRDNNYKVVTASDICAFSDDEALKVGKELNTSDVDCLVVAIATFIPDYYITELLKGCDKPVFLWAIDRELHCIPMVCLPLITASLYNLNKTCCALAGEVNDKYILDKLLHFANASLLFNRLKTAKIGYSGYRPRIMYSMESNAYLLDKHLGITIIPIPMEKFYNSADEINVHDIRIFSDTLTEKVGCIEVGQDDLDLSIRYYLAAKKIVNDNNLFAYSINCFPHLKAKICLGVSLLNDEGIGSGCEGDIHASILMSMTKLLTGDAAFNGDFLKLYPKKNQVMFSHCGAGALSLAGNRECIALRNSAETMDGVGVFYATDLYGKVTLINLMNGLNDLRLSCIVADAVGDDSGYIGNPLTIEFSSEYDVRSLPDILAQKGAGHHWVGLKGDYHEVFRIWAKMSNIEFSLIEPTKFTQ